MHPINPDLRYPFFSDCSLPQLVMIVFTLYISRATIYIPLENYWPGHLRVL